MNLMDLAASITLDARDFIANSNTAAIIIEKLEKAANGVSAALESVAGKGSTLEKSLLSQAAATAKSTSSLDALDKVALSTTQALNKVVSSTSGVENASQAQATAATNAAKATTLSASALNTLDRAASMASKALGAVVGEGSKVDKVVSGAAIATDKFVSSVSKEVEAARRAAVAAVNLADAHKLAAEATLRGTSTIDPQVKALERQASMIGKSAEELLELKRVWDIMDFGNNQESIDRINFAYDQMAVKLRQARGESEKPWKTQGFDAFMQKLDSIAATAARLGILFSATLTAPIVGLASKALDLASNFEQANIAFTTMLGSGHEAAIFLEELKQFAARTPFEFPDLLQAAKRLQALGFAAEDTIPIMRSVGDAVAGLGGGAALIDRVTMALGQMRAKGKVSAEEMNQLAEAGIPAWNALAKEIGVSIPEAMKMASQGAISASKAIPAILAGMSEKFGNLMGEQAKTAAGQFSNLKDNITFTLADIGKVLLPFANTVLNGIVMPLVSGIKDIAQAFAEASPFIQGTVVVVGSLAAAVGPLLLAFSGLASTVSTFAPMAASLASTLGFGAGGLATVLGAATPLAIALGVALAGMVLYKVVTDLLAINAELERFEAIIKRGMVATKAQTDEIKLLESALASHNRQLGVQQIVVDSAGKSVAEYLTALRQAAFAHDMLGGSMRGMQQEVSEAEKKVNDLKTGVQNGTAKLNDLVVAAEQLRAKKKALGDELVATKERLAEANKEVVKARTELMAAKTAVESMNKAFQAGLVTYDKVAEAQNRVDNATTAFNNATARAAAIMDTAAGESGRYSGSLDEMRRRMTTATVSTKSLEDQTKALKASVKAATQEYQNAIRLYAAGKISMEQLGSAWFKLQEAFDKAEPEKAAKRHGDAATLMKKQQDDLFKFFKDIDEKLKKANDDLATSATKLSNDFAKAYQHMKAEATKVVAIVVPLNKRIPEGIQAAIKEVEKIADAYHQVGLKTPAELQKLVNENKKAWEKIKEVAGEGSIAALQAEIEYRESQVELARQTGEAVKDEQVKWIEKAQQEVDKALGKQTDRWKKFGQQVSTIVTDLGRDVADALLEFAKGFFNDDINNDIREQQQAISDSLDERAKDNEDYQEGVRESIEETKAKFAESLSQETTELLDNLSERTAAYAEYASNSLAALESFKQAEAGRLDEELTKLSQHLAKEEGEFEEFQESVGEKQREIREDTADRLAEQLRDLEENLEDRKKSFSRYVEDINNKLGDIGVELEDDIGDISKEANDDREDENNKYNDKVLELNDDLNKAIKAGDKEKQRSLRQQLEQAARDHEKNLRRIGEDEKEAISDSQRRAQQQTRDLNIELERRTTDHKLYLEENARDQAEAIDKAKKKEKEALEALEKDVEKRTEAILRLREETAKAEQKAHEESITRIEEEEAKVLGSIQKRGEELEEFRTETLEKIAAVTAANEAAQDAELAKIAKTTQEKIDEYEAFKEGALAEIEDLETKIRGPLDRFRGLLVGVAESAAEAFLRLGAESLWSSIIDGIKERLKDTSLIKAFDGFIDAIGKKLADVFSGIFGSSGGVSIPTPGGSPIPTGGNTPSIPGGDVVGSAASGAMGLISVITGLVSAVSDVITAIYAVRQEGTLNAIEENTRFGQIHLENILNKANEYWPKLGDVHSALINLILPTLREIRDGIKNFVSVNIDLGPGTEAEKSLLSSIITRVGQFDTTANDRLLDIKSHVLDVVTAVHDNTKQIVQNLNAGVTLIVGKLQAIEGKAPSLLEKILGMSPLGGGGGLGGVLGGVGQGLSGGVTSMFEGFLGNLITGSGKDIPRVEENTRYTAVAMIGPGGVVDTLRTFLPELINIRILSQQFLDQHAWRIHDVWEVLGKISDSLSLAAGSSITGVILGIDGVRTVGIETIDQIRRLNETVATIPILLTEIRDTSSIRALPVNPKMELLELQAKRLNKIVLELNAREVAKAEQEITDIMVPGV